MWPTEHHVSYLNVANRSQELCENRGERPEGVPNKPDGFCGRKTPSAKEDVATKRFWRLLSPQCGLQGFVSLAPEARRCISVCMTELVKRAGFVSAAIGCVAAAPVSRR